MAGSTEDMAKEMYERERARIDAERRAASAPRPAP